MNMSGGCISFLAFGLWDFDTDYKARILFQSISFESPPYVKVQILCLNSVYARHTAGSRLVCVF